MGIPTRSLPPDEAAVHRCLTGEAPVRLHPADRRAAVDELGRQGLTVASIARRLGCTPRTVHRIRAYLREQS